MGNIRGANEISRTITNSAKQKDDTISTIKTEAKQMGNKSLILKRNQQCNKLPSHLRLLTYYQILLLTYLLSEQNLKICKNI